MSLATEKRNISATDILYGSSTGRQAQPFVSDTVWLQEALATHCYFENTEGCSGSDNWLVAFSKLPAVLKNCCLQKRPVYQLEREMIKLMMTPVGDTRECQLVPTELVSEATRYKRQESLLEIVPTTAKQSEGQYVVKESAVKIIEGLCSNGLWRQFDKYLFYYADDVSGIILAEPGIYY